MFFQTACEFSELQKFSAAGIESTTGLRSALSRVSESVLGHTALDYTAPSLGTNRRFRFPAGTVGSLKALLLEDSYVLAMDRMP